MTDGGQSSGAGENATAPALSHGVRITDAAAASWRIVEGSALDRLRELPDDSVHCCVTSPPYFGLRDYGVDGQIGLESTLDEFLARLLAVFAEVHRVLRPDGTLWVNMGDSYASKPRGSDNGWDKSRLTNPARVQKAQSASLRRSRRSATAGGAKQKDLMGVPWMLAFALREQGWWLREDVIWNKPTPMPEPVADRCTRAHEYIFRFTKRPRYFADQHAVREPLAAKTLTTFGTTRNALGGGDMVKADNYAKAVPDRKPKVDADGEPVGANKRSVWTVPDPAAMWESIYAYAPAEAHEAVREAHLAWLDAHDSRRDVWTVRGTPYPEAHFATFPPELVEPMILSATSPHACGECGAPWERVLADRVSIDGIGSGNGFTRPERLTGGLAEGNEAKWTPGYRPTSGWKPTCDHNDSTGRCVVLDCFSGAATSGLVALRHDRSYIGIELNQDYAALSRRRIIDDAPLLNAAAEEAIAA